MIASALSPAQRRELKGRAHSLSPVVLVGGDGLTQPVLDEIERALGSHELIKVRATESGREQRAQMIAEICERTGAQPVQVIGKMLVLYRRKPEPPAPPPREVRPRRRKTRRKLASRRVAPPKKYWYGV
ncbi:MAG: ribosome assembly RNA-binding protein YhbY [Betaproteobacteria bacterium]|nr:ribosome assembly RNA-binding protein YhbY [Betaproteobacteria bacterium]